MVYMCIDQDTTLSCFQGEWFFHRVVYPPGKPIIPHGLRPDSYGVFVVKGLAVNYYGFTLDAVDLGHSRLLQR